MGALWKGRQGSPSPISKPSCCRHLPLVGLRLLLLATGSGTQTSMGVADAGAAAVARGLSAVSVGGSTNSVLRRRAARLLLGFFAPGLGPGPGVGPDRSGLVSMAEAARLGAACMKRSTHLRCSSDSSLALRRDISVSSEELLLPCNGISNLSRTLPSGAIVLQSDAILDSRKSKLLRHAGHTFQHKDTNGLPVTARESHAWLIGKSTSIRHHKLTRQPLLSASSAETPACWTQSQMPAGLSC